MRGVTIGVVLGLASVSFASGFDVTTAFSALRQPAGLPTLRESAGTFAFTDRPGATSLVVDRKNGFIAWSEGERQLEFAVFRTSKRESVAVLSSVQGNRGGPTPPVTRLEAWTVEPTSGSTSPASRVVSSVPFLEAFVAPADEAAVHNLDDQDLAPWIARVVKLPRQGLTIEVTWAVSALERECATPGARAPELLCRNVAPLKYGLRRATWDRASATFTLVPLPKR